MAGDKQIFRQTSLDRLSSPEQLDQLMTVNRPHSWLALVAICAILASAVVWSITGSLPTTVVAQGILIKPGGVYDIFANGTGQVVTLGVAESDTVTAGQVVATIDQPELAAQIQQARQRLNELRDQHRQLTTYTSRDLALRADTRTLEQAKLHDTITFSQDRLAALKEQIENEEQLLQRGLITKSTVLQTRAAYFNASDLLERSRNDLKQLEVVELSTRTEKEQALERSQMSMADAERAIELLTQQLEQTSKVTSPYSGRILEVKVRRGDVLGRGAPIASLQLTDAAAKGLETIIYVPPSAGKSVRPGMPVEISPTTAPRQEYGFLRGTVTYVSEFPSTRDGMMRVLSNDTLVAALTGEGAPFAVYADLIPDAAAAGGYQWSSSKGNELAVNSGTLCSVTIRTRERRPIEMVIPILRQATGL